MIQRIDVKINYIFAELFPLSFKHFESVKKAKYIRCHVHFTTGNLPSLCSDVEHIKFKSTWSDVFPPPLPLPLVVRLLQVVGDALDRGRGLLRLDRISVNTDDER